MYITTDTTDAPNKAHLLQWVRALESGNYAQGKGKLKTQYGGFCCLGVACDVAAKDVNGHWEDTEFVILQSSGVLHAADNHLPREVADWLGIPNELRVSALGGDVNLKLEDGAVSATELNDARHWDFASIAAAIRAEFELPTKEQDEHRLAWIKALESGEYKQTGKRLRDEDNAYCCLGVACDLAAKDGVGSWRNDMEFDANGETQGSVLPTPVSNWLGVASADPKLGGEFATKRNDTLNQDFAEIAAAARIEFGFPSQQDEIKAHQLAWIEALESGKYEQGDGKLKYGDRYCCLGVACDLAAKDGVGHWTESPAETVFVTDDDVDRSGILPSAVSVWLGVPTNTGDPLLNGVSATKRNDTQQQSFEQIAEAARIEFGFPPRA